MSAVRSSSRLDASGFLLLGIVLLLGAGVLFTINALRQDPIEEAISGDRVINTMFVVEDAGKPLGTYILMYYPATRRAAVFDIPGNVGQIIPSIDRVDRIDALYQTKNENDFELEIERLLGVEISFQVVLTLDNLGKLTDLLGGVELFIPVPVAVYDPAAPVFFPSGLARLDGDKAKSYLVYRLDSETEESQTWRRQRFFLALLQRMGEQSVALKNRAVNREFQSLMTTNMNARVSTRLFEEFAGMLSSQIGLNTVGGNNREISGQRLLIPYYDGNLIKEIVRQSLAGLTRQIQGASGGKVFTVEVLNGSGVSGMAGRTAELLRSFGYDVTNIGNAETQNYEETVIVDRSGLEEDAEEFGSIIRCTNFLFEAPDPAFGDIAGQDMSPQNYEYRSDFTLIIGKDFDGRYVR
jgi:anionic cell wall polymer biosynthesis LytR-Cps2A-Psr (LCP) family protein